MCESKLLTQKSSDTKNQLQQDSVQKLPLPVDSFRRNQLLRGLWIGAASSFFSVLGASVTFPFLQAQRDTLSCDALCYGSMQSLRSGLSLIGNVLMGRISDKFGRAPALWMGVTASLVSYAVGATGTIEGMFLAIIPSSLLNQNYSVLKALFADYGNELASSEAERASSMGRLGMMVGVSFMLGPPVGALLLNGYYQATLLAAVFTVASAVLLVLLPVPQSQQSPSQSQKATDKTDRDDENLSKADSSSTVGWLGSSALSLMYLPVAQTSGARLLFLMRAGMALAFSVFMTVWTVSLKQRFSFGASDHAYFMGWVGLCYAISQGVLARLLIQRVAGKDGDPTRVLLVCMLLLGGGRVFAMRTHSVPMMYALMALVIVALGVVNTAMSAACARLAGPDEVGGLFGVLEGLESLAGLVGPALGGLLYKAHPQLPVATVVLIYGALFIAVGRYYRTSVVLARVSKRGCEGVDTKMEEEGQDKMKQS